MPVYIDPVVKKQPEKPPYSPRVRIRNVPTNPSELSNGISKLKHSFDKKTQEQIEKLEHLIFEQGNATTLFLFGVYIILTNKNTNSEMLGQYEMLILKFKKMAQPKDKRIPPSNPYPNWYSSFIASVCAPFYRKDMTQDNLKTILKLATEALDSANPEETLNFNYAASIIGKLNVELLEKKRGMKYFLRYSPQMLEMQVYQLYSSYVPKYANLDDLKKQRKRPVLLALYNKSDPNGAFYFSGEKLDMLAKHFFLPIYEMGNDTQLDKVVPEVSSKYGKITHLILSFHGTPRAIAVGTELSNEIAATIKRFEGKTEEEAKELMKTIDIAKLRDDIFDQVALSIKDMDRLKNLSKYLKDAVVVLESCETAGKDFEAGNNPLGQMLQKIYDMMFGSVPLQYRGMIFAQVLSDVLDAKSTFAANEPTTPILAEDIRIKYIDGKPEIIDVALSPNMSVFDSEGKLKMKPVKRK